MKGYLISVVLITAMVALASHLLSGTEAARYGKLSLGIVLLWAVLSPLVSVLTHPPSLPPLPDLPAEDTDAPLYAVYAEEGFCKGIADAVSERFSIPAEGICVRVDGFDAMKMTAEHIHILLRGKAVFADGTAIAAFLEDEGLGKCEVEIEIGTS